MNPLAQLDREFVWHPFTQMRDWLKREPIVIVRGKGAVLEDVKGRRYLDANSSIWTNLHGHNHPALNAAIRRQLDRIAHCSALGLANEPASLLAQRLIRAAGLRPNPKSEIRNPKLARVFFSDDGSTAMEVALKLAYEYARRSGRCRKPRFLSLEGAYHGDTVGAVSLGHIGLFHQTWRGLIFKTDSVMAPYCYRCPFNRARPERADAREYRKCNWECVGKVEHACRRQQRKGEPYAGFVFEPIMQGAAGMIAQPRGWLQRTAEIVRGRGTLLIADEVMTAFGRVGQASRLSSKDGGQSSSLQPSRRQKQRRDACPTLLASHIEGVQPDLAALAKGLTGGYLPMAATLATEAIFDAFLGEYDEFKTFFHGHSFTGNPLGAAAGIANLQLLHRAATLMRVEGLEGTLRDALKRLWRLPNVGDIRQAGLVAGIELVRDWRTRKAFDLREQAGIRVCHAMARRGVLTRPIGNVIVLMPPYCTTRAQVRRMVQVLAESVSGVLGS
jgi:adenosylmethionine-8-amino-7-oxononanoate aminotransferase